MLNKLRFKLAHYNVEGEFLGFYDMTDQFFICQVNNTKVDAFMTIGTTTEHDCLFDLKKLTNPLHYPVNTNIFYEVYLVDYNGDLIDVPVRINGGKENYRRFFMLDTLSGLEEGQYLKREKPSSYLRYAKSFKIKVTLDPDLLRQGSAAQ